MHRVALLLVAVLAIAAASLAAPHAARAAESCSDEQATSPVVGGGIIEAVHVEVGNCTEGFQYVVIPQSESGGLWRTWECFNGSYMLCRDVIDNGGGNFPAAQVVEINDDEWNPELPNGWSGDPNHLCNYRTRIKVNVFHGSTQFDTFASSAIPASC